MIEISQRLFGLMSKPLRHGHSLNRRELLRFLGLHSAGLALASIITSIHWLQPFFGKNYAHASDEIPWGYGQDNGPERWGTLSEPYQTCATGANQSPIDLQPANAQPSGLSQRSATPVFHYRPTPLIISNTGHTIQGEVDGLSTLELDGVRFKLLQFHFHHPSEHRLGGDRFPMEMHFVHKNEQGALAVVGLFLTEGAENKALKPVWKVMPQRRTKAVTIADVRVDLEQLLPSDRTLFRYQGSLTTPPCSELVQWLIFKTPLELSAEQVTAFKDIFSRNARPTQPINGRLLLEASP